MKLRYTFDDHVAVFTIEEFVEAFNGESISDLGWLEVIEQ